MVVDDDDRGRKIYFFLFNKNVEKNKKEEKRLKIIIFD